MILTVIVSAFSLKRIFDIKDLLDGLSLQTYKFIEVIVVIDENADLLREIQSYINFKNYVNMYTVFNIQNKGLSYSRNVGIEHSSGEIIAFIDDDAVPSKNWAKSIIETFEEDEMIGAVTGDVIPLWENESMSWFPKELYWMISCSYVMTPSIKKEVERGFGVNMAFAKKIFSKVGVFDTTLGINGKKWIGGEDTDLFLKVKNNGMKVIFNPDIKVFHKISSKRLETKSIIKRAYDGGFSLAYFKVKTEYPLSKSLEHKYFQVLLFDFLPTEINNLFSGDFGTAFKKIIYVNLVLISEAIGFITGSLKLKIQHMQ